MVVVSHVASTSLFDRRLRPARYQATILSQRPRCGRGADESCDPKVSQCTGSKVPSVWFHLVPVYQGGCQRPGPALWIHLVLEGGSIEGGTVGQPWKVSKAWPMSKTNVWGRRPCEVPTETPS